MKTLRFVTGVGIALAIAALTIPVHAQQDIVGGQESQSRSRGQAQSQQDGKCQPGIERALGKNDLYAELYFALKPNVKELKELLEAVEDQPTYEELLARAEEIASTVDEGRVVIALPDGTVVLDTAAEDDPMDSLPEGYSYAHYQSKTVNENHNSRVAFFSAQLYPCGVGVESKFSTSTGQSETYVAIRLGQHLNSAGTARLSTVTTASEGDAPELESESKP